MDSLLRILRAASGTNGSLSENASVDANFSCLVTPLDDVNVTNATFWQANRSGLTANIIIATIVSIYFVVAFSWNLFIIVTYLVRFKVLKEPANIFLFVLAIVDFLVTITIMLYTVIILAASGFVFGSSDQSRCTACDAFGYIFVVLIDVSHHTLVALSIDRFILLAWPLRYKAIVKTWKALVVVIAIWVFALALALPPLVGFGQYEFNQRLGVCLPRFSGQRHGVNNIFYMYFVLADVLISLSALFVTNVWTFKIISRFLQRSLVRRKSFRETSSGATEEDQKYQRQQQQLIKVFSALFVAHLISWSFFIVVLFISVRVNTTSIPNVVYVLGWLFYLTHPVVQPIIETFFVKDLRYQVRKVNKSMRRTIVSMGSAIVRVSQGAFSQETLDKVNRNVDQTDNHTSLKSRMHNKKPSNLSFEESSLANASTATECMFVGTPTPELHRHEYTNSPGARKLEKRLTWSDQSMEEAQTSHNKAGASTTNGHVPLRETVIDEREENDDT